MYQRLKKTLVASGVQEELDKEDKKGPTNVTNAMFVGSTADLQKMLKNINKDEST